MSEPDILYPAIFVFSMLLIGLLLTMWEFSRLRKSAQTGHGKGKPVTGLQAAETNARIQKASSF